MLDIETVKKEYKSIIEKLGDPELISDLEKFEELSRKRALYEKLIGKEKELKGVKAEIEENQSILSSRENQELASLAQEEIKSLKEREISLEKELGALLKGGETEPMAAIVEIRAGAGGEEAAIFVADLFRMYSRYAEKQGWNQKLLESHPTEIGGFKLIAFELKNGDVFSKIQHEGGVHRVQRIPATEKGGRLHTSTASVAVLPKPKRTEIKISPGDLKIDTYRASGPGGQYVNKRETAIRITHLPSGLVVTSQTERNQLQNKENALSILAAKVKELKELEELDKVGSKRKDQIKRAKRAEKIRTYNFPQDRVTDHRIQKSWHNIEKIMDGDLDQIIKALEQDL